MERGGHPFCILHEVSSHALAQLGGDLADVLKHDEAARAGIACCEGALLQSAAFGFHEDLDFMVRTGYLLGDRVVLWDYLGRMLRRAHRGRDADRRERVAAVANSLVELEPLARAGKLVILAHPLDWSPEASNAIKTVAVTERLTPGLAGMYSTVAAAAALGLNSYTISDNNKEFQRLLRSEQPDERAGRANERMLLTGLLASRLLSDRQFSYLLNLPLERFQQLILEDADFYRQLRDRLAADNFHDGEYRLTALAAELERLIHSRNVRMRRITEDWAMYGGTFASVIGVVTASAPVDPHLRIAGALISLAVSLARFIPKPAEKGVPLVAMFRKLERSSRQYERLFNDGVAESSAHPAEIASKILSAFPKPAALEICRNLMLRLSAACLIATWTTPAAIWAFLKSWTGTSSGVKSG
jgi:hypothetical protein